LDDARKLFLAGEGKNASYYVGNPNIHITSWMTMPAYEADFGWGKPIHFGIGSVTPYDRGLILTSPDDGDGSVIVCMHFQVELMQLFKKFFYGDLYDELLTSARL
jgi:shikimate O-hydroxycinnamoyltransferase